MRAKDLVYGALLTALSLIIPIMFGTYLRILLPPFSATLASHVPVMISMLISPLVALLVGAGSALGFLFIMGPVIAARAAVHMLFGALGGIMIKRGSSYPAALLATAPIHALGEALIVLPFGFSFYQGFYVVGIGTLLHHGIDALLALILLKTLEYGFALGK
ncbi:MAG: ECF transporter S component [Firmicutes bacterium]|nr:ECF transporter S component [Bacillota bacterium]